MTNPVHLPERFVIGAFDAFPANVAVLDEHGVIIAVNRSWIEFSEQNNGESAIGYNYLAICDAVECGAAASAEEQQEVYAAKEVAQGIRQVLAGAVEDFEIEYPCHSHSERRYFLARVSSFMQDGQRFVVVLHHNITRRKLAELEVVAVNQSLEERVYERTQQLEATQRLLLEQNRELGGRNSELAQFAYVASHDLQEPLRIVGVLSDLLLHRQKGQLDAKTQQHLKLISEQVARARQLVKDLLTLSDVKSVPLTPRLQMAELWQQVAATLDWPAGASYTCDDDLPTVQANRAQMQQLLNNLLGNAIKFAAHRPLVVRMSAQPEGQMVHFVIADNGIGIAPEYRQQVFAMFGKLHHRSKMGGNGIGLAVCQKIIEQHGGKIWLEGGEQGTEVHFTLLAAWDQAQDGA